MSTDNHDDVPLAAGSSVGSDAATFADGSTVSGEPLAAEGLDDGTTDGEALGDEVVVAKPSGKRMLLALLAGLLLALLSGVAWAFAVHETGRRWAVIAVVFGLVIGHLMRKISGRTSVGVAVAAALLAVLGAAIGSWLEVYVAYGQAEPLKIGVRRAYDILGFGSRTRDEFVDRIDWITGLTWGLAALSAFVYAFDSGRKKQVAMLEAEVAGPAGESGADELSDADRAALDADRADVDADRSATDAFGDRTEPATDEQPARAPQD